MALKVSCPNCLSLLQVPRKLRGKVVVCPCCKEKCRVPMPSTVGAVPAAITHRDEVAAEARAYDPSRGTWIRTAVIASIAAAVVAVGGLLLSMFDFGQSDATLQANAAGTDVPGSAANEDGSDTPASPLPTEKNPALAAQAEQVLRTHCYRCHGQDGVAEGGFNFVLRRDRLVSDGHYIQPGQPDASMLLTRITDEEMPPAGETRPSKEEISVLSRWIAAGAPDFAAPLDRIFIAPSDLVKFIRKDLENDVPSRDHRHTRYFTLVNLFNAGFSDDEMETYRLALSKLVNSLSWHNKVVQPRAIDPHKTIYRIDVRTLGWDDSVWQAIIDANPYSVKLNDDDLDSRFCLSATQCQIPHVRADWFVAAASRPPLYHTVLQVPETLKELLTRRFPEVDLEKDIKQESVVRVGFGRSGVSSHNRLLEWHHSAFGYFWISYDFAEDTGRKNLFQHPLGPGKGADDFEHDGGEIIFSLPNGLQGYMLVDAAGKRIDKGPTSIVSDPKRPDRAVTNGVSCMSCHYGGIIAKSDEIRKTVEANRTSFRGTADQILALYPVKKEVDQLFAENAARFRQAVQQVGIKELTETGEPVVNMSLRFETDVDARSAAAELGLTLKDFLNRLRGNGRVQDRLGPLNVEGGTVKRDLFAKEFTFVVEELRLGEAFKPAREKPLANKDADKPKPADPPEPAKTEPENKPAESKTTTEEVANNTSLRTWSDVKKNTKVEAEFVNLDRDKVELRKADGTSVQIPFADLSPDDRKFVNLKLLTAPEASLPPGEYLAGDKSGQPDSSGAASGDKGQADVGPIPPKPGPPVPAAPLRAWRNLAIEKTIQASFVSLVKGELKLQEARFRGALTTWPMEHLSPEDHEYVRKTVGEDHYEAHKDLPY